METNSIERVETTIALREPDRVPTHNYYHAHAAKLIGTTYHEYCTNSTILAKAYLFAQEKYSLDMLFIGADAWVGASAVGVPLKFTANSSPQGDMENPFIKTPDDLDKLHVPDPKKDGRMPIVIEGTAKIVKEIGSKTYICTHIDQGPFSLALELMGEDIFRKIVYDPSFVKDVLKYCMEVQIEYGMAVAKTGVQSVSLGEPPAGLLSPKNYREFALPYSKQVVKKMHEAGVLVDYHICGNNTHILDIMTETEADIVDVDSLVKLSDAKKMIGNKVCLLGNLDPIRVFLEGTPEEVEQATMQCIKDAAEGGGYIASGGCEIPGDTPPQNILTFIQTVRKYGKYPIRL